MSSFLGHSVVELREYIICNYLGWAHIAPPLCILVNFEVETQE